MGNTTVMSKIASRRVVFCNGNHFPIFYMPYWSSYGALLYIVIDSTDSVTINKARTDMENDLLVTTGWLVIFINDLTKWKFITKMITSQFSTAITP